MNAPDGASAAERGCIASTVAINSATPPANVAFSPSGSMAMKKVTPPATSAIGSARRGTAGSAYATGKAR